MQKKLKKAIELYEKGLYKDAIEIFDNFNSTHSDNVYSTALNYKASCYFKIKKFDKAVDTFYDLTKDFTDEMFIENMLIAARKIYYQYQEHQYTAIIRTLKNYIHYSRIWYDKIEKEAETYYTLALVILKDPYGKKSESLEYIQKALDIEPNNQEYQDAYKEIQNLYDNSLESKKTIIPDNILEILNRLKAPCKYMEDFKIQEGVIPDSEDDEFYYVFGINNNGSIGLPKSIERIELYYNQLDYECDIKYFKKREPLEDCTLKSSYNFPDYYLLKDKYSEEFKSIRDYLVNFTYEGYDLAPKYIELIEKFLGHQFSLNFIGGHINPVYAQIFDYEDLNFIMQYQGDNWTGNWDILFIFNKKEKPEDLIVMIGH